MTRTRLALAALTAAALLSACQDDPEPKVADPTPSSSVSDVPPTLTATTGSATNPKAPDAAVREWVNSWNAALTTGDTTQLRSLEATSCRGCDELIRPLEEIGQAGGRFEGGAWSLVAAKVVDTVGTSTDVNVAVDVAAGTTTPSAGASPTAYPATKHLLKFKLESTSGQWLVSVIELLS